MNNFLRTIPVGQPTILSIALALVMAGGLTCPASGVETPAKPAANLPAGIEECVGLLREAVPGNAALIDSVIKLVNQQAAATAADASPSMMVVSYRQNKDGIGDVVVQLYSEPSAGPGSNLLNPDGSYVQHRLGSDAFGAADQLMGMLYYRATFLGNAGEVERQQRAFEAGMSGDLTLLREQTIEPLNVIAVMPRAGKYLPGSLRTRVHGIVLNSQLEFSDWKSSVSLLSDDAESAQQVGTLVSAWREIGVSLADTYASTPAAQPLREALKTSSIEVVGNNVVISGALPAQTIVRVSKELAGHGGGCPAGPPCKKGKVAICHIPPGNPGNAHTICIAPSAVPAHLAHGDYCGPCKNCKRDKNGNIIVVDVP